ncbi:DUF1707 domain-containing protein [Microlunatus elymi]|uniref:DUF1707 domain-containing protein n=1 Tax=Microlunatus elymi TaxID=2596828 RepID=A0A516PYE1_9ACTN|nr:DUF1707 domain-containing protein [Microlunatus elymi]QDP96188.1 DUF1707 domain-containing protein [Microlunatus elymi]
MSQDSESPLPAPMVRASDHDREAAAEQLRAAVSDGRLELSELDERLTAVYRAKTRAEVAATTVDLEPADTKPLTLTTKSGFLRRTGVWSAPAEITAQVDSGSIKLDFTGARVPGREVLVRATAKSGRIVLVVPHDWAVVMDDVSSGAGRVPNKVGGDPATARHVVRVVGTVGAGVIKARYPRRRFIDWIRGRSN